MGNTIKPAKGRWPDTFLKEQLVKLQTSLSELEKMNKNLENDSREPIDTKEDTQRAFDTVSRYIDTAISNQCIDKIGDTRSAIRAITRDLKNSGSHQYGRCQSETHDGENMFIKSARLLMNPHVRFCNNCQEKLEEESRRQQAEKTSRRR